MGREAIGTLHLQFKANTKQFSRALKNVQGALGKTHRTVEKGRRSWAGYAKGILGAVAAYKALQFTFRAVRASFATAIEFERQHAAIEALTGSARDARKLWDDLLAFSLATPFTFMELIQASKQLLAFNFSMKEILPTIAVVGKAAAATGQNMADAIFPFAQARTEWKQVWKDIRQFTSRGMFSIQDLADTIGIARGEVKKFVEEGNLAFPMIAETMRRNAAAGGRFDTALTKIAESVFGLTQRFKDLMDQVKKGVGEAIIEVFNLKQVMKDIFTAVGQAVISGKFKALMVEIVTTVRDLTLVIIGTIENVIRANIRALGLAAEIFGGVVRELDKALGLFFPGKGFGGSAATKTRPMHQLAGESDEHFRVQVANRRKELEKTGQFIDLQMRRAVLEMRPRGAAGRGGKFLAAPGGLIAEFTTIQGSAMAAAAIRLKQWGKSLQEPLKGRTYAEQLEDWINPTGFQVVGKSLEDVFDGMAQRARAFQAYMKILNQGGVLGAVGKKLKGVVDKLGFRGAPFRPISKALGKVEGGGRLALFASILANPAQFATRLVTAFGKLPGITDFTPGGKPATVKAGTGFTLTDPRRFRGARAGDFAGIRVPSGANDIPGLLRSQLDQLKTINQQGVKIKPATSRGHVPGGLP